MKKRKKKKTKQKEISYFLIGFSITLLIILIVLEVFG